MIPNLGGTELLIVLVIILLLFGAKRIPELARGLGNGIREFKKGTRGEADDELREEKKKDEELTAGAGEEKDSARGREEAAHAEQAERSEQKR